MEPRIVPAESSGQAADRGPDGGAEIYTDLDGRLRDLLDGYTLTEVLERLAAVLRRQPCKPDISCLSGTVFSQRAYLDQIAATLEELSV